MKPKTLSKKQEKEPCNACKSQGCHLCGYKGYLN